MQPLSCGSAPVLPEPLPCLQPLFPALKQRPAPRAVNLQTKSSAASLKLPRLAEVGSPALPPSAVTHSGTEPGEGHSRGEPAGDGQLVAPLDAPVLLPLDPRDGSGRLLGGDFIPAQRELLAAEVSPAAGSGTVSLGCSEEGKGRAGMGWERQSSPTEKKAQRESTLRSTKTFKQALTPSP